jgi:phage/plasmid-associated DNA primase
MFNINFNKKHSHKFANNDELRQFIKECNNKYVENIIALAKIKKNKELFYKYYNETCINL